MVKKSKKYNGVANNVKNSKKNKTNSKSRSKTRSRSKTKLKRGGVTLASQKKYITIYVIEKNPEIELYLKFIELKSTEDLKKKTKEEKEQIEAETEIRNTLLNFIKYTVTKIEEVPRKQKGGDEAMVTEAQQLIKDAKNNRVKKLKSLYSDSTNNNSDMPDNVKELISNSYDTFKNILDIYESQPNSKVRFNSQEYPITVFVEYFLNSTEKNPKSKSESELELEKFWEGWNILTTGVNNFIELPDNKAFINDYFNSEDAPDGSTLNVNMKGGYNFTGYKDNVKLHTEMHFTEMIKYLYNFLLKHEPFIGKQSFLAKKFRNKFFSEEFDELRFYFYNYLQMISVGDKEGNNYLKNKKNKFIKFYKKIYSSNKEIKKELKRFQKSDGSNLRQIIGGAIENLNTDIPFPYTIFKHDDVITEFRGIKSQENNPTSDFTNHSVELVDRVLNNNTAIEYMNDFYEDKDEDKESEYFTKLSNIINTQDTDPEPEPYKNKKFRYGIYTDTDPQLNKYYLAYIPLENYTDYKESFSTIYKDSITVTEEVINPGDKDSIDEHIKGDDIFNCGVIDPKKQKKFVYQIHQLVNYYMYRRACVSFIIKAAILSLGPAGSATAFLTAFTTSFAAYGIIGPHVPGPLLNTNDLKRYDKKCSHSFDHTIIPFNRVIIKKELYSRWLRDKYADKKDYIKSILEEEKKCLDNINTFNITYMEQFTGNKFDVNLKTPIEIVDPVFYKISGTDPWTHYEEIVNDNTPYDLLLEVARFNTIVFSNNENEKEEKSKKRGAFNMLKNVIKGIVTLKVLPIDTLTSIPSIYRARERNNYLKQELKGLE